jgi:hypothetical protein
LPLLRLGLGLGSRLRLGPSNTVHIFARTVYVSIILGLVVYLVLFGLGRLGLVYDFNEVRAAGTFGFVQIYHEVVRLIALVAKDLFFAHAITFH